MDRPIPLGRNVVVWPDKDSAEAKTPGGIILPSVNGKDKTPYMRGVVIEKGKGDKYHDMKDVVKGDTVLFPRGAGRPQKFTNDMGDEVTYLFMDIDLIIAVL